MPYDIEERTISPSIHKDYLGKLVGKIYKILPIYEDCFSSEDKNFYPFYSYLEKLVLQLKGSEILFKDKDYLSLITILMGLQVEQIPSKKKIKSIVFHCVDMVEKMRNTVAVKKGAE